MTWYLYSLITISILSIIGMFILKGWKNGLISLIIIVLFVGIYILTVKIWDEEGKIYLAIVLWIIALFVLYYRIKRGKNIWY